LDQKDIEPITRGFEHNINIGGSEQYFGRPMIDTGAGGLWKMRTQF
jgi:hypothetical protein